MDETTPLSAENFTLVPLNSSGEENPVVIKDEVTKKRKALDMEIEISSEEEDNDEEIDRMWRQHFHSPQSIAAFITWRNATTPLTVIIDFPELNI